ncbi:hypothetical protein ACVIQY_001428 [Bradyrhizobium sp. USDA 3051]
MQRDQIVVGIERAGHLALGDRVISAVRHVLFARPQQLDRRARHLLGDQDGLADIVGLAAPAEAAARHHLVHVALLRRQARRFQRGREGCLAILRAAPDLAFVRRVERRGVHWLHGGVVLVGIAVDGLDFFGGTGNRRLRVAVLVADIGRLPVIEALGQPFRDRLARDLGVVALVPDDRQRLQCGLGVPPGVGNDGDRGVADLDDLLDAFHAGDLGFVIAFQLAAEHRAILDRGVQHARQLDIDAVDHGAGGLLGGVQPLHALADQLPVLGVLQLDLGRRRQLGRGLGDLAVGRGLAGRRVGNDAVGGRAFGRRHFPRLGGGLDQHHACGGTALADVVLRRADAAAAAGREIAPDALAGDALARCRIFGRDLRPVAFEFLGDELGKAGEGALAHFGAGDADDDGVVGPDHDPGADLRGAVGRADHGGTAEGDIEADCETCADRGGADDEGTAVHPGRDMLVHVAAPYALAIVWIASRTCWKVPQRQILVMASSMSASVGFGFSLSSAATAMIMPLWQ